ncbi:hypothetical protein SERIO_v1c04920 [Spiroplasma eriocheiris]|uniref:Uncharacterized protein n=1 Tax=Spiroplasma eriocheiris TaxID=315358 RepID=A0A0H3XMD7_9MOLU|nr:hypothetical protein SERIO_v1c04920 [Spiroplasma eriocheiris]
MGTPSIDKYKLQKTIYECENYLIKERGICIEILYL